MAIPTSELQSISPSSIIELFQLVLNSAQHGIDQVYCFHAGTNVGGTGDLVFNGVTFTRFPVDVTGFEYSGEGQLPRPKIQISNILGTITAIILSTPRGLEGARLIRIRTLARYIDAVNFPARRNLLTTTSSFTGNWQKGGTLAGFFTATTSAIYSPEGNLDATRFESTSITSQGLFLRAMQSFGSGIRTLSLYVYVPMQEGVTSWSLVCDGADSVDTGASVTSTEFNSWVRISVPITYTATRSFLDFNIRRNGVAPTAAGFVFHAWGAQLEDGTAISDYQAIGATFSQNPYGTPDPTAEFPREVYYLSQKTLENREVVEYEAAAAFDLAGVRGPKRQCIANLCSWKYRSAECSYNPFANPALYVHYARSGYYEGRNINSSGQFDPSYYLAANPDVAAAGYTVATAYTHYLSTGIYEGRVANVGGAFNSTYYLTTYTDLGVLVYFDENDRGVTVPADDACGKRFTSCLARFGGSVDLPFGGFPGLGQFGL